jgi:hypothetical protein
MNAPFQMQEQKLPDVYLSGDTVEKILMLLNNSLIFVKAEGNVMRPFVDPTPIINIIQAALQSVSTNASPPDETRQYETKQ